MIYPQPSEVAKLRMMPITRREPIPGAVLKCECSNELVCMSMGSFAAWNHAPKGREKSESKADDVATRLPTLWQWPVES